MACNRGRHRINEDIRVDGGTTADEIRVDDGRVDGYLFDSPHPILRKNSVLMSGPGGC